MKLTKKKLIMLGGILVVFVGAAVSCFLLMKKPPEPPDFYSIEEDQVVSITSVVGERTFKKRKEIEDTENKDVLQKVEFTYADITEGTADVQKYINELTLNHGFTKMPKEGEEMPQPLKEGEEPPAIDPEGTVSAAIETAEAGVLFQVDIDYTNEGYTVYVKKYKGKIPEPPKVKEEEGLSRNQAMDKLNDFAPEVLGLPEPASTYVKIPQVGRTMVDGKDCYMVNVYRKQETANIIMGIYAVALDKSAVYKYDLNTDTYTLLN